MSNRNIIKTYKICRPYVVTLLNQTPILERHRTVCSNYVNCSRFNCWCNWKDLCDHLKRKIIFTSIFNFSLFLHLNSDSKPLNDTLRDSQLLTTWVNSRSNSMPQIVCEVGSAHNSGHIPYNLEREGSHRNQLGLNSFHKTGTQVTSHDSKTFGVNMIMLWALHPKAYSNEPLISFHAYNT